MNKSLNAVLAIVLAGSGSLAHAQSTAQQSFVDRYRVLQSESSEASAYQLSKPAINASAPAPNHSMSERDYQAQSSWAPAWHPNAPAVESSGPSHASATPLKP